MVGKARRKGDKLMKFNNKDIEEVESLEILKELTVKKETETVTITVEEYDELAEAYNFLNCLEACGVDNWNGYDDARQMMSEGDE